MTTKNLKNLWVLGFVAVGIVLMLSGSVNAYSINGNVCTCNACDDCSNALNDNSCTIVKLTADITNHKGTCISILVNNKIFDCQGHKIDGYRWWDDGIYLNGKSGNTIKNCIITDFYSGIYLDSSSNNLITNNTLNNSWYYGIYLDSSSYNNLTHNTLNNNDYGIYSHNSSYNLLTNNTANNNNYYGIWLRSSSNNALTNNTANNNEYYGIYLNFLSYNNLTDNTANNNGYGIYSHNSSYNTLNNNTINNNAKGVFLYSSSYNALTNNIANNNGDGIYLSYSLNNNLTNNIANNNNGDGIWIYSSSNNTLTHNMANNNHWYGIDLYNSSNNTMVNNTVNSNNYAGVCIFDSLNFNKIEGNEILNNKIGIFSYGSSSIINNNYAYGNIEWDFYSTNWLSSYGDNNTWNNADGWNDNNKTGCTNHKAQDIFDVVEMLEYLSGQRNITQLTHLSEYYKSIGGNDINLHSVFVLMNKIIISGYISISDHHNNTTPSNHALSNQNYTLKSSSQSPLALASTMSEFKFEKESYHNSEYSLPLKELPENYERDIVGRFGKNLSDEEKEILLNNGVLIIPGSEYDRFENVYSYLKDKDIPTFVTSDSVLHLFHIEFNEILKNLEIKKLSPMLKEFLSSVIEESEKQYNGLEDEELKELERRNIAYLSVAMKLLDPKYKVPSFVSEEVNEEIKRINDHKGFYKSPLFSLDCPEECLNKSISTGFAFSAGNYPNGESCLQAVKGLNISYQGKEWDSMEFYKEVCTRKCYCEDYSQYIPRGHYTGSEELKQYFKSMMWLGRMSFKARGENWTKQAALLTLAVQNATANFDGKEISAKELWNKIYSITGFFAGASDDLTFYDYANALNKTIGNEINLSDISKINASEFQNEIAKLRGPKILGGFEIDLAGNLKDLTQGLRLIGQRYALDSQILGDLVYKNVGPNPESPYYNEVINYCVSTSCLGNPVCSQPKEFYYSCKNLSKNETKYWNEVCDAALELYCGCGECSENTPKENIKKLWSVCRFMPTGLDVANTLGSEKAEDVLNKYYHNGYCGYDEKQKELKNLASAYSEKDWTKNMYNTWLWMLKPVLKEKSEGYPNWMRSDVWKLKDLITSLSSWAELRHDTILYVKQSYTWGGGKVGAALHPPIKAKYYSYVEPNPELFARAKYAVDYLKQGLEEQGVMTEEVNNSLKESSEMMERLKEISEKELRGEILTEDDYDYIKGIGSRFNSILENLASALKIKSGSCPSWSGWCREKTSLEGKDNAFKTSMIADVHTDANTEKVLEVGTGKIDWLLVAHKSKDGRIGVAVGPIFSYYEFAWPMEDRLTDEKWRNEALNETERPVLYKEINLSFAEGYIV